MQRILPLKLLRRRTQLVPGMRCRECILLFLRNKQQSSDRRCKECERLHVMQLIYDLRQQFGFQLYDD